MMNKGIPYFNTITITYTLWEPHTIRKLPALENLHLDDLEDDEAKYLKYVTSPLGLLISFFPLRRV